MCPAPCAARVLSSFKEPTHQFDRTLPARSRPLAPLPASTAGPRRRPLALRPLLRPEGCTSSFFWCAPLLRRLRSACGGVGGVLRACCVVILPPEAAMASGGAAPVRVPFRPTPRQLHAAWSYIALLWPCLQCQPLRRPAGLHATILSDLPALPAPVVCLCALLCSAWLLDVQGRSGASFREPLRSTEKYSIWQGSGTVQSPRGKPARCLCPESSAARCLRERVAVRGAARRSRARHRLLTAEIRRKTQSSASGCRTEPANARLLCCNDRPT